MPSRNARHPDRPANPAALSHRQSARRLRPGRHAAAGRHRSHLGVRLRAGHRHPRQGQGPHAVVGLLVRQAGGCGAEPLPDARRDLLSRGGAALRRGAAGPHDADQEDAAHRHRVRGARLPVGIGLEGISRERHGVRHHAAGGPRRNRTVCPRRSSRRRPRRPAATTSTSTKPRPRACWETRRCLRACARSRSSCTPGPRPMPSRAGSSWPTRNSSSASTATRCSSSTKRSRPTPRASGPLTSTLPAAPSRASTSSSSATISSRFAGTSSRPCRRCPTMSWPGRGTSTWTRLPGSRAASWS